MPIYEVDGRRPEVGKGTWIAPSAEIIGDVRIGKNCYIGFGAIIRGDYGTVEIGDDTAVEEAVVIHARPGERTSIGSRVTLGHMAMIHNCTIRDFAVIGMKATVSDYAVIGEWAFIGEHALVVNKKEVPAGKIFAGVPAKEIGDVAEKHKEAWTYFKQKYVDLTSVYRESFRRID
jgi:carbonic anhydrase/acetyltransferase-like protein (isoleucine patch superfamily)